METSLIIAVAVIGFSVSLGLLVRGIIMSQGREFRPIQVSNKQFMIFMAVWFFFCMLSIPAVICCSPFQVYLQRLLR
jgi:hypothetical protein